jgi:hypothetical protein
MRGSPRRCWDPSTCGIATVVADAEIPSSDRKRESAPMTHDYAQAVDGLLDAIRSHLQHQHDRAPAMTQLQSGVVSA